MAAAPLITTVDSSCNVLFDKEYNRMWTAKPTSRLAHASQLDIDQVALPARQTSILCTLGDSWSSPEDLEKMIHTGMNVLVLNMSMTPRDTCKRVIEDVRKIEESLNFNPCVAIAMDMTAAPVRTGLFDGMSDLEVVLEEGGKLELTTDEAYMNKCTAQKIYIDTKYFPQLIHSVHKGDRIHIDDGTICLIVKDTTFDSINCLIEEGGSIGGYKRVTLPRERLYQHSVYANYIKDLEFAGECGVDFVFTSFSENASFIKDARDRLPPGVKIFSKIETRDAFKNSEKIFKLQKHIIGRCNVAEKPVFVIDQLLETMRMKPRPTRAETSDVANAVLDGADSIILTVETSWGKYPFETVEVADQICREAERAIFHDATRSELKICRESRSHWAYTIKDVTGISAVEAAASCNAKAILVITTTGVSAISISASRPSCSVIAITRDIKVGRLCYAYRGLHPFVYTGEHAIFQPSTPPSTVLGIILMP
ncbi:unnamed protein product [Dibothriocephalus latus]|uniref:Pyruvate kinase n=1 Tax=Dibothriocephalus latus TaxID=60516 RepID=A0A3P7P6J5_DIBLA|nr:unnamed protein product [Dibothriocephalus latus]